MRRVLNEANCYLHGRQHLLQYLLDAGGKYEPAKHNVPAAARADCTPLCSTTIDCSLQLQLPMCSAHTASCLQAGPTHIRKDMNRKITKHGEHADNVPQSHTAYTQRNTTTCTSTCHHGLMTRQIHISIGSNMMRQATSGPIICLIWPNERLQLPRCVLPGIEHTHQHP